MANSYTVGIAAFAAIGTFLFVRPPFMLPVHNLQLTNTPQGFDTGIATTSMLCPSAYPSLNAN